MNYRNKSKTELIKELKLLNKHNETKEKLKNEITNLKNLVDFKKFNERLVTKIRNVHSEKEVFKQLLSLNSKYNSPLFLLSEDGKRLKPIKKINDIVIDKIKTKVKIEEYHIKLKRIGIKLYM